MEPTFHRMRHFTLTLVFLSSLAACERQSSPEAATPSSATAPVAPVAQAASAESPKQAEIGKAAPDFSLTDLDGKAVRLADYRGKTVVLEWFNPGCPFVQKSHTKGSLKTLAATHTARGVVWLAINSGAPGKQGHGREANIEGKRAFGLSHPVLLDEAGTVGKAYGATNTPHMFVIDAEGTLVYRGAIDNSPDAEGEAAPGGKLINYVDQAVGELSHGKAVSVPETKAYGCSVKYR